LRCKTLSKCDGDLYKLSQYLYDNNLMPAKLKAAWLAGCDRDVIIAISCVLNNYYHCQLQNRL
jgi:hypothetical protein